MDVFGDVERFASEFYAYRWALSVAGAALLGGGAWLVLRAGWHRAVARHWLLSAAVGVPAAVVVVAAGWYALSPLWERSYLDEASPLGAAPMARPEATAVRGQPTMAVPTAVVALPRVTAAGMFMGADDFHFGRGAAQIIETAPGVYTLRFEDFSVRNGPDLFVYLTPDPSGASIDGAVNLGGLKATDGAFNYEIPAGTDVTRYASAVVWCRQFAVLFAVAPLVEA